MGVKVSDERKRILKAMSKTDPSTEEYKALIERLNSLPDNKFKLDVNGIIQSAIKAGGPIMLGLLIIAFEKKGGAFVSQASKFIRF